MDGRSAALSYQGLVSYCLSAVPHSNPVRADTYRLKPLSQLNLYLKSHSWFKLTLFFLSTAMGRRHAHTCLVEQLSCTAENVSRYVSNHLPVAHHGSEVSITWDNHVMYQSLYSCYTLAPAWLSPYICCQKGKLRGDQCLQRKLCMSKQVRVQRCCSTYRHTKDGSN